MSHIFELLNSRLNPVMLKEIRQDLRSKAFLRFLFWSVVLQGLSVLFYALVDPSERESYKISGSVWIFLVGGLLMFFPGRAWGSFSREEKANSLELILLTRLTGLQIAFGKWSAVLLQSVLFFLTMLPFVVFFYFSASTPAAGIASQVVLVFLLSILLCSFSLVGGASSKGKSIPVIGGIIIILVLIGPVISMAVYLASKVGGLAMFGKEEYVVLFVYCVVTSILMLLITASRICPLYENYAASKRIVALIAVGITAIFLFTSFGEPWWSIAFSAILLVPVCVSACFEELHPLLGLRLREKRFTPWLTYSGWPQGMLWSFLLLALYFTVLHFSDALKIDRPVLGAACVALGIVTPRALMLVLPRLFGKTIFAYFLIHLLMALGCFAAIAAEGLMFRGKPHYGGIVSIVVSANPIWMGMGYLADEKNITRIHIVPITGVVAVLVLFALYRAWRRALGALKVSAERSIRTTALPDDSNDAAIETAC